MQSFRIRTKAYCLFSSSPRFLIGARFAISIDFAQSIKLLSYPYYKYIFFVVKANAKQSACLKID